MDEYMFLLSTARPDMSEANKPSIATRVKDPIFLAALYHVRYKSLQSLWMYFKPWMEMNKKYVPYSLSLIFIKVTLIIQKYDVHF